MNAAPRALRRAFFFTTPQDQTEMEARIRNLGPVVFFESRSDRAAPQLLLTTAVPQIGRTWPSICAARPVDLESIRFERIDAEAGCRVDELRSPAIEFSRCDFDGQRLGQGRLCYVPRYHGEDGDVVHKSAAFVGWAKSVLRAAVKGLAWDQYGHYLGPEAARLHAEGELTFISA